MFLLYQRYVITLLAAFALLLDDNGFLTITKRRLAVGANGIKEIDGPFLQIERHNVTRLIIENPHVPHFLACLTTIVNWFYQNETKYYYTWFRNDEVLLDSYLERRNDFYIYDNGTLRLPPNEKTSGVYRCKINANSLAVISESITVEYPVLKRLVSVANVSAIAGMPVTLNCPIVSVPTPANITWNYGNVSLSKIFNANSRFLFLSNGSLVLRKLTRNDVGKYKCSAHNAFSWKSHRQFTLSLTIGPSPLQTSNNRPYQLLPPLQNTTVYIRNGTELRLMCHPQTEGANIVIEWWYQRNAIAPLTKWANNSNVLYERSATTKEHDGYYTCRCTLTKEEQRYRVIVTVAPVVQRLPSYKSHIASSVTFRCQATGNPKPVISWYHNGMPLNSSYTRYINGDELLIHSFDPDEEGIYQCFARNIAGEQYSAAELRYDSSEEDIPHRNPLHNIRCFAHSFNTINVTFDTKAAEFFIVHIVQNNPHRWIAPFAPMKLNYTSYVVISSHLPVYRPFELITRVLFPTSDIYMGNKQQQTIESSLRSPPVTCCTQGLLLHLVSMGNESTFVTWSLPDMESKKFFILQFSINSTAPHPQQVAEKPLLGTMQQVNLTQHDVESKLTVIETLSQQDGDDVLKRAERKDAFFADTPSEESIFSVVVTANVTGVLMQNFTRIKMRALIITQENEHLAQDFRYVQWKIIENDTSESGSAPFRLTIVESRMLVFHFEEGFNDSCIYVCHLQIHFPYIKKEEPKCDTRTIVHSQLELRSLKPSEKYRVAVFSCKSQLLYGHVDVQTLPDPPGTISNQSVIRHNGLKLTWDPPLQPNGRVHHYNILWTLGNVTHEANVLECSSCSYKFPNITERAKINVTVRVVGETGVGAPIFIDLRTINLDTLDIEKSSSNSEVYSGIAIGSLLSTFCVCCFALLIIFQRRRFKARQQGPTHLSTPTDVAFGNLNNPGIPGDSAGGLSATLQQDCHEMQTLIPKSRGFPFTQFLGDRTATVEYRTTQLPNGNGNIGGVPTSAVSGELTEQSSTSLSQDFDLSRQNLSQVPLCSSTPHRKGTTASNSAGGVVAEMSKPFFIAFKNGPPNVVASAAAIQQQKRSSSNDGMGLIPPSTLPLATVASSGAVCGSGGTGSGGGVGRRSGSLSSSSAGSSSSSSGKKQFHTNFPKHSTSNDGICLLAEEESAATLTPTSESEDAVIGTPCEPSVVAAQPTANLRNGYPPPECVVQQHGPIKDIHANNNNSKQRNATSTNNSTSCAKNIVPQNDANAKCWSSSGSATKKPSTAPAATTTATNTTSVKPVTTKTKTTATTTKPSVSTLKAFDGGTPTSTSVTKTNAHRRPNVDPNG